MCFPLPINSTCQEILAVLLCAQHVARYMIMFSREKVKVVANKTVCETWKVNERDNRRMDTFQFKCLRINLKGRLPYVM